MTCVVGWIDTKNKRVVMGADSLASDSWQAFSLNQPKIWKHGEMLIGCTGSVRFLDLLRYGLTLPEHVDDVDPHEYMVVSVIPILRKLFLDNGFLTKNNEREKGDGLALIGYRQRLFVVEENFAVTESTRSFAAVGSGYCFALGACTVLDKQNIVVRDKVQQAIEAAIEHNPWCGGEIVVLEE